MKLRPKIILSILSIAVIFILAGFLAVWGTDFFLTSKNEIAIELKRDLEASSEALEKENHFPAAPENFCAESILLRDEADKSFCFRRPKVTAERGLEVDLTSQKALLYEGGKLVKVLPVAYQSKEGKWYQTPTGYFTAGVKHEKHRSSLFPVNMNYAVQFYEDFFFHEIPTFLDGTRVSSNFSGGCLRFEGDVAKEIFDFIRTGDQVIVYKNFGGLELKSGFSAPVDISNYWIRQRFNNALRNSWDTEGTGADDRKTDYYQHAGVDLAPNPEAKDWNVYAISDGTVSKIVLNGQEDYGFGNAVIIEHKIEGSFAYALYGHLAEIEASLAEGKEVRGGEKIGRVGNTGFGCDYWRIKDDGCESSNLYDNHLHLELKDLPMLENPSGGNACKYKNTTTTAPCYGYTPDNPLYYGYRSPMEVLFNENNRQ